MACTNNTSKVIIGFNELLSEAVFFKLITFEESIFSFNSKRCLDILRI